MVTSRLGLALTDCWDAKRVIDNAEQRTETLTSATQQRMPNEPEDDPIKFTEIASPLPRKYLKP